MGATLTPEQLLQNARECLAQGDYSALLGQLRQLDETLLPAKEPVSGDPPSSGDSCPSVDGAETSSYAAPSDLSPARAQSLRAEVSEILQACQKRQRETLDELIVLRSKGRSTETSQEEVGTWFKGRA